jgi:hypothetical protein
MTKISIATPSEPMIGPSQSFAAPRRVDLDDRDVGRGDPTTDGCFVVVFRRRRDAP